MMLSSLRHIVLPLCGLLAMVLHARVVAQASARIEGIVRDQGGQPVLGAQVRFAPGDAATLTDSVGRFVLRVPALANGTLTIQPVGFEPVVMALLSQKEGARHAIFVTLPGLARLDVVSIVASRARPLLNTRDAATGGAIERTELERLPTDARDPMALAYNIPGVAQSTGFFGDAPKLSINGANSLYTQ